MSLEKRSVKNFEIKIKFESRAWTFQEKEILKELDKMDEKIQKMRANLRNGEILSSL